MAEYTVEERLTNLETAISGFQELIDQLYSDFAEVRACQNKIKCENPNWEVLHCNQCNTCLETIPEE